MPSHPEKASVRPIGATDVERLLPTGCLAIDPAFRVQFANATACRLLTLDEENIVGGFVRDVLAAYPSLFVLFQRYTEVQQEFHDDVEVNGKVLEVTFRLLWESDGERTPRGALVFFHDVTARRLSERTLADLLNEKQELLEERDAQNRRLRSISEELIELRDSNRVRGGTSLRVEIADVINGLLNGVAVSGETRRRAQAILERLDRLNASLADDERKLTSRERQVAELASQGFTSKAIAQQLGLSKRTIDVYRSQVKRKLGLETKADWQALGPELGQSAPAADSVAS